MTNKYKAKGKTMALENEGGLNVSMPVAPAYSGYGYPPVYYGGAGTNGFGGDWSWLIVLFLFAFMGNGSFGMGGGMGGGFPWLLASNANSQNATSAGLDQIATGTALAGIQSSINDGFSRAEVAACGRAMDAMERSFAAQTAATTAATNLSSQLATCCCENRLATANLSALVQSENCEDRAALATGVRDIIVNQTANTQKILDTLCQDKIDAKNEKIAELERIVTMRDLAASQTAQTAALVADNTAQTQYLINRIAPYPVPAYTVPSPYGYGYGYTGYGIGYGSY